MGHEDTKSRKPEGSSCLGVFVADPFLSNQNRIFAASCTLSGSPAPIPGAPLPLRVLVSSPKVVELDSKKEYQRYVWIEPNQEVAYRCTFDLDACEQPVGTQ